MVAAGARYRIRPARRDDADALARVEEAAFDPKTYGGMMLTARSFRRHADGPNALIVSEDLDAEGAPVCGYALGFVKRGSPYVRFVSLAILPEHGGKGAGRMLFEGIEAFALDNGLRGVRLEIREDNHRLLERYLRLGYRVFATVPDYYPDGAAAIRMVKDIRPGRGSSTAVDHGGRKAD
jgi:ribosomal protein S18 acetylase RimI-like enzyme